MLEAFLNGTSLVRCLAALIRPIRPSYKFWSPTTIGGGSADTVRIPWWSLCFPSNCVWASLFQIRSLVHDGSFVLSKTLGLRKRELKLVACNVNVFSWLITDWVYNSVGSPCNCRFFCFMESTWLIIKAVRGDHEKSLQKYASVLMAGIDLYLSIFFLGLNEHNSRQPYNKGGSLHYLLRYCNNRDFLAHGEVCTLVFRFSFFLLLWLL